MHDVNEQFDVRLSRLPLALLLIMGSSFLIVGLDLALLHLLFPHFSIDPEKKLIFFAFLLFAVGCGGIISVQMLLYLIKPPVIFRTSLEGIAFGTGFRYHLVTIPWKHVGTVTITETRRAAGRRTAGLEIVVSSAPGIAPTQAPSLGVIYAFNRLTLSWFYMGRRACEVRERILEMKKRYG